MSPSMNIVPPGPPSPNLRRDGQRAQTLSSHRIPAVRGGFIRIWTGTGGRVERCKLSQIGPCRFESVGLPAGDWTALEVEESGTPVPGGCRVNLRERRPTPRGVVPGFACHLLGNVNSDEDVGRLLRSWWCLIPATMKPAIYEPHDGACGSKADVAPAARAWQAARG
jgi:hypothetical protein